MEKERKVVAWSLRAASATGSKDYRIMIIDKAIVVSWGSTAGTLQHKGYIFPTTQAAFAWAASQTEIKEKKGYALLQEPRVATFNITDEWIAKIKNLRGATSELDSLFKRIMAAGQIAV